jgi:Amt family ammonium transporter
MVQRIVTAGLVLGLMGGVAYGEAIAHRLSEMGKSIDTMWVLVAAFLVFFMQAGFAMLEAGFTRAKNAGNAIMKGVMDYCAGSLFY